MDLDYSLWTYWISLIVLILIHKGTMEKNRIWGNKCPQKYPVGLWVTKDYTSSGCCLSLNNWLLQGRKELLKKDHNTSKRMLTEVLTYTQYQNQSESKSLLINKQVYNAVVIMYSTTPLQKFHNQVPRSFSCFSSPEWAFFSSKYTVIKCYYSRRHKALETADRPFTPTNSNSEKRLCVSVEVWDVLACFGTLQTNERKCYTIAHNAQKHSMDAFYTGYIVLYTHRKIRMSCRARKQTDISTSSMLHRSIFKDFLKVEKWWK